MTIVDKAALEAAKQGIRRRFLKKESSAVALDLQELELEETKLQESDLERAYIRHLAVIQSGSAFGDLAFKSNGLRNSSIRTAQTSEMLIIDKEDYLEIMNSEVGSVFSVLLVRSQKKGMCAINYGLPVSRRNLPL